MFEDTPFGPYGISASHSSLSWSLGHLLLLHRILEHSEALIGLLLPYVRQKPCHLAVEVSHCWYIMENDTPTTWWMRSWYLMYPLKFPPHLPETSHKTSLSRVMFVSHFQALQNWKLTQLETLGIYELGSVGPDFLLLGAYLSGSGFAAPPSSSALHTILSKNTFHVKLGWPLHYCEWNVV